MAGLSCPKKLWFDTHERLRTDSFLFHLGNRFGDYCRTHYGEGFDLTDKHGLPAILSETREALLDINVNVIYEAAFLHSDTLIRADVLIRKGDSWEMVEVKSSSELKDDHITDASIQAYVIKSCGLSLASVKVAHLNTGFLYKGDGKYDGILIEDDVTNLTEQNFLNVKNWISQLKDYARPDTSKPQIPIGRQCIKPYKCIYLECCEENLPALAEVPISVIPYASKKFIQKWADKGIHDLRDIPVDGLEKPSHRIIQQAHISNSKWVRPNLESEIKALGWPRFFMDFETVQQGVPIIPNTKPREAIPFQWSVHKWVDQNHDLKFNDGYWFLEFNSRDIERNFLEALIANLGDSGPIFAHHADTECNILRRLIAKKGFEDLAPATIRIIERVIDTLKITKEGFYHPDLRGSYSLKDIVKAIRSSISYQEEGELTGGDDAQIAWFRATNLNATEEEKNRIRSQLLKYCAKDTYALYDLIRFLSEYP